MWLSYRHSGPSMTTPKSQFQVGPGTTLSLSGRWLPLGCIKTKPNKTPKHETGLNFNPEVTTKKNSLQTFLWSFADHLYCKCMWVPNLGMKSKRLEKKKQQHIGQCPQKHFCSVHKYSLGEKKKCLSRTLDFFSFFGACNFYQFVLFLLLFFSPLAAYKTSKQKSLWNKIES